MCHAQNIRKTKFIGEGKCVSFLIHPPEKYRFAVTKEAPIKVSNNIGALRAFKHFRNFKCKALLKKPFQHIKEDQQFDIVRFGNPDAAIGLRA